MKVLLFSTQWPEYMIELANAVSMHCNTILMLATNHRFTPEHEKLISNKVLFEPFEVVFYKSIRKNGRMLFHILKVIWKHKPDILHIQSNGHKLFYWVFFLKPWKTKLVNTIHDPVKHLGDELSLAIDDARVIFWSRIFTDKFIVHGTCLKDLLAMSYHVNKSRISVIPHGHFEIYKKFQKYTVNEDQNTILFFGRIWKYKGLDVLIDAANLLIKENPKLKFIIAGFGEDIKYYQQKVKFNENITFVNRRIPNEEVGPLFEKAMMVVLPYREATQSGVIPIAYAYSKPVVVTHVGSLPEVVIHYHTGMLVEPNSVESLANGIGSLIKDPAIRKKMGENAYRYAKNELSWYSIAQKTFELYASIL
jgi:glycosyltransferase involved in cell wall biosynthesis